MVLKKQLLNRRGELLVVVCAPRHHKAGWYTLLGDGPQTASQREQALVIGNVARHGAEHVLDQLLGRARIRNHLETAFDELARRWRPLLDHAEEPLLQT